jgi:NAD(P)-dependent dehydrogenase (short-subunit alcohol dehydrogenase family)
LRPGLLEGVSVLLAVPPGVVPEGVRGGLSLERAPVGLPPEGALGAAVAAACTALGARVSSCRPEAAEEAALDAGVAAVVEEAGRIDLLVVDGAGLFVHALAQAGDGHAALRGCMDAAWNATRAVVNGTFLPAPPSSTARRIVYLAPAPDAGEYAPAACAGLENLARTLSVEWARHGITTVTIAPGAQTPAGEVAALTAYLASPAGAYFSGCLLDLRGP